MTWRYPADCPEISSEWKGGEIFREHFVKASQVVVYFQSYWHHFRQVYLLYRHIASSFVGRPQRIQFFGTGHSYKNTRGSEGRGCGELLGFYWFHQSRWGGDGMRMGGSDKWPVCWFLTKVSNWNVSIWNNEGKKTTEIWCSAVTLVGESWIISKAMPLTAHQSLTLDCPSRTNQPNSTQPFVVRLRWFVYKRTCSRLSIPPRCRPVLRCPRETSLFTRIGRDNELKTIHAWCIHIYIYDHIRI